MVQNFFKSQIKLQNPLRYSSADQTSERSPQKNSHSVGFIKPQTIYIHRQESEKVPREIFKININEIKLQQSTS
jgi:hypothetical protein